MPQADRHFRRARLFLPGISYHVSLMSVQAAKTDQHSSPPRLPVWNLNLMSSILVRSRLKKLIGWVGSFFFLSITVRKTVFTAKTGCCNWLQHCGLKIKMESGDSNQRWWNLWARSANVIGCYILFFPYLPLDALKTEECNETWAREPTIEMMKITAWEYTHASVHTSFFFFLTGPERLETQNPVAINSILVTRCSQRSANHKHAHTRIFPIWQEAQAKRGRELISEVKVL